MTDISARLLVKQLQQRRIIERALENFRKIGRANLTPAKIRSRMTSLKDTWQLLLDGHVELER